MAKVTHVLFLRWVLLVTILATLSYIGILFGAIGWIHRFDPTYITFSIAIIGYIMTCWLGAQYWKVSTIMDHDVTPTDGMWRSIKAVIGHGLFTSWLCGSLGLLGTIIGFVKVVASFQGLHADAADQIAPFIQSMGVNLGTAFVTTLGGLVAQVVISLQCHHLETVLTRDLGQGDE